MKLHDILKGSDYSLDLFVQESINALENRIIDKVDKKGKPYYSVNCIIRGHCCPVKVPDDYYKV